jgi:hypothetical protein
MIIKILIRTENRDINAVRSKTLGVLGHAKFFEQVPNLLQGGPLPQIVS